MDIDGLVISGGIIMEELIESKLEKMSTKELKWMMAQGYKGNNYFVLARVLKARVLGELK